MQVIDLTLDSPPPKGDGAAADDGKRARKKEREEKRDGKREKRQRRHEDEMERQESVGRGERHSRHEESERHHGRDGKRRRESSRGRDPDRKRSRRSREHKREPPVPDEELFYIDATPTQLPAAALYVAITAVEQPEHNLILPAHVSVFGETPAALPEAAPDSDDDDYIEYLDYGNRKDFVRYYDDKTEEKRVRVVCKKCGAGTHYAAECPVLICTTCGVRDEHPTRNCNIGKTCFSCGMKGHISMDCPNRLSRSRTQSRPGCDRCNALSHQTSECPLLWRLYEYVEDAEQESILQTRKSKKGLALGQGGEGYIAGDAWCYNCGGSGHWGDDCREFYHHEPVTEPTAFSSHVLSAGPFSVPEEASDSRAPREWVREVPLPGGMEDVGRRGRNKEKEKLGRHAQQVADDTEDWFQQNSQKTKRRADHIPTGPRAGSSKDPPPPPFVFTGASSSKMSLSSRLTDPPRRDKSVSSKSDRESRGRAADSRHHNERDQRGNGPRYKGGYSR